MAFLMPARVSRQLSLPLLQSVSVACVPPLLAGYSIGYSSPALTSLRAAGVLSESQGTVFASLLTFGGLVGAVMSSYLLERFGRKPTLFAAQIFALCGFCFISFYATAFLLFVARILCGISAAFAFATAPLYIAEVAPSDWRGALGSCVQLACTIGILLVYLLGALLGHVSLALVGSTIAAIGAFFVLTRVRETPRWLLSRKRKSDALHALLSLRTNRSDAEDELRDMEESYDTENSGASGADDLMGGTSVNLSSNSLVSTSRAVHWRDMFTKQEVRRPLNICLMLMALQQLSGINAIMFYSTDIFNRAGLGAGLAQFGAILIALTQVIVTAISSSIIDRSGRRVLLIYGALLMAVPCALLYLSYLSAAPAVSVLPPAAPVLAPAVSGSRAAAAAAANQTLLRSSTSLSRSSSLAARQGALAVAPVAVAAPAPIETGGGLLAHPLLPIAALMLYMVGFSIGWGPVPMLLMSEMLPSRYRNLGSSTVIFTNWGASLLVTSLFGPVSAVIGQANVFLCFSLFCVCATFYVLRSVPETRGKTLEDIELYFFTRQLK